MPYRDSNVTGGKVRLKTSTVAGETIAASGLVVGELALNAADGAAYFRTAGGGIGQFPSSSAGVLKIESLTQGAYDSLVSATATLSTTLYIVTPNP